MPRPLPARSLPARSLPARPIPALTALLSVLAAPAGAQDAAAPVSVEASGSLRLRYETLSDQVVAGRQGGDQMLAAQSTLDLAFKAGDFTAEVELYDARRLAGDAGGAAPSETDALEPSQAFLSWRPADVFAAGDRLDVTAGRFTMDVGSRRLVSRSNFRLVLQSFTGVRGEWRGREGAAVTAFWARPTVRRPSDAASALDNEAALNETAEETAFSGLHLQAPVAARMRIEAYVIGIDEQDEPGLATRDRDLVTWGARLLREPKAGLADFEIEAAAQTGASRATASAADTVRLDHEAYMLHAEAGFSFDAPWSPRLAAGYDLATGDRDPADGRMQRFDPLYGDRSFDLGPTGVYGAVARSNMRSPWLRLELKPDARSDAFVALRRIELDAPRDSFATSNVRDPSGASGRHAADQLEVRWRRWLKGDELRLTLGGTWLKRGAFLKHAPNAAAADDPLYGYAEIGWFF